MSAVIGLDLSITATGIADVWGECETLVGLAQDGDKRIGWIAAHVDKYLCLGTDLVVIEGLAVHGHGNGMAAAQVMGAVKAVLIRREIPYVEVPPSSLKKYATGKGNAGKPDMAVALYKRTGLELGDDNQVDAAWLRFMGLDALGCPEFELPAVQRAAMEKVQWPAELVA